MDSFFNGAATGGELQKEEGIFSINLKNREKKYHFLDEMHLLLAVPPYTGQKEKKPGGGCKGEKMGS